jgi:6-pyruvoyl-tetrahydropterin synthase
MRLFVDNLTNIDFSYLCPERGLVGETWLAHVQLEGSLDHQGMICDFGIVKKKLRDWLDKTLDHCLLVPIGSNAVRSSTKDGNTNIELTLSSNEYIRVQSPSAAITLIDTTAITPESTAEWCLKQLQNMFDNGVAKIHLSFSSETIDTPYYHYSHGLKKHQGHCQRIAHGHRSKLLIWRDNQLCIHSMREWAERWRDIYIGTQEDCNFEDENYLGFTYMAYQGVFQLTLPKRSCYLITTDTTVELLAQHLASMLSRQYPNTEICVQAFEGIGKGAIVMLPAT